MASFIDENTQFVDTNGKPLVDGSIYIGENSFDPILNPITIYSDRDLTIVLANPQTLDSSGRSTNKIWIPGRYSFRVDDENDVQKLIDLDAGQTAESGVTSLAEIQGTNDITAEASTTITSYVDKELYVYNSVNENTGPVTLDIDNVGVTPVKKNHDQDIQASDFQADMIIIVVRNELDDTFEWVNQNLTTAHWTKGADIASATSLPLINDGNYNDVTGVTTITSFASIGVGTIKKLHFDDALVLTHNATILILPGTANITTAAGDEAEFIEYAANSFICTNYSKADGTAVGFAVATQADQEAGTSLTASVTPGRQQYHPSAAKMWASFTAIGAAAIYQSYNVNAVVDSAVGQYVVQPIIVFSANQECAVGTAGQGGLRAMVDVVNASGVVTTSVTIITCNSSTGTLADVNYASCVAFGDQP